ncbi:MAG: glycosyltransferase family 4 protein [Acidobacteria bacterium]|nr:glycosyltransferase family 4 protein [Acidobacteriota bacterium]
MNRDEGQAIKILYVAPAEEIPGSVGGSVHVEEVAKGLGKLGYHVDVLCRQVEGYTQLEEIAPNVRLHRLVPKYHPGMLLWRAKKIALPLAKQINPDYIIERYYNFGGAGVFTAKELKLPLMLEVNSPVVDHPGSLKKIIDTILVFRPMKRYRESMCRIASDIITPLEDIIPYFVEKDRVHRITWGAAVDKIHPGEDKLTLRKSLGLPEKRRIVVFTGSFRKWHGVWDLANAVKILKENVSLGNFYFLMIGDGPERESLEKWINDNDLRDYIHLQGRVPYKEIPGYLAAADIGIAPYNPAMHRQLKLGFYWSPLKIFEYMAAGLPVITIKTDPLDKFIEDGEEGLLYRSGNSKELAKQLMRACEMKPVELKTMGASGRQKVEKKYSWQKHCRDLDDIIKKRLGLK